MPKPVGQECLIPGEEITFNNVTITSFHNSPTDNGIKVTPEGATPFVEITLEKCKTHGLNGTFPVNVSFITRVNGTTVSVTPADSEKTLKFGEAAAKLTQEQTIQMYDTLKEEEGEGIATTTVP